MFLPVKIGFTPLDTLRNLLLIDRISADRFIRTSRNPVVQESFWFSL